MLSSLEAMTAWLAEESAEVAAEPIGSDEYLNEVLDVFGCCIRILEISGSQATKDAISRWASKQRNRGRDVNSILRKLEA